MKSSRKFATPAAARTEPELVCEVRVPRPRVTCPHCGGSHKVRPEHFGRLVVHKRCSQTFQMPRHVRLDCPSCLENLRVPPEAFGQDSECRFCGHIFRAQWADGVVPPPEPENAAAPPPGDDGLQQRVWELEQENHLLKARLVAVSAARAMDQEERVETVTPASATTEVVMELEEIDKLQSELAEAHSDISALQARVAEVERAPAAADPTVPAPPNPSSQAFREACRRWDEERRELTARWEQELNARLLAEQQLREHQAESGKDLQRLRDDFERRLDQECQAHLEALERLHREGDTARSSTDQTLADLDMGDNPLDSGLLAEQERAAGRGSARE